MLGPAGNGVHCETGHSFYSPSPTGKVSLSVLGCPAWGQGDGGNVILPFLPSSKCLYYFHAALQCCNLSPGILTLLKIIFRYYFCAQMFVQIDVLGGGDSTRNSFAAVLLTSSTRDLTMFSFARIFISQGHGGSPNIIKPFKS